jgi:hypothetical protein
MTRILHGEKGPYQVRRIGGRYVSCHIAGPSGKKLIRHAGGLSAEELRARKKRKAEQRKKREGN